MAHSHSCKKDNFYIATEQCPLPQRNWDWDLDEERLENIVIASIR